MQRIARFKHRCRQHNKEIVAEHTRHNVTVEKEHMKCRMCAKTKQFDKVTIFLTQQCSRRRPDELDDDNSTIEE